MRLLLGDTSGSIRSISGDGNDSTGTTSDPTSNIDSLSRSVPRPTNAQALAALEAQWEATDKDAAVAGGFPEDVAEAYFMTLGILPRMRMLACGWTKPGDKMRLPTDAAWWAATYAHPLWAPLWTYANQVRASGATRPWSMDPQLASGEPGALSHSILGVASELAAITRLGHDVCAPYLIPRVRNVLPQPSAVCIARIGAKKKKDDRDKDTGERKRDEKVRAATNTGVVLLVGFAVYAITFHHKHGRWPWS